MPNDYKYPDDELLAAAHADDLGQLRKALFRGADPNALDSNARTALHRAVRLSDRPDRNKVVEELLRAGARVNATDPKGNTALHLALEHGDDQAETVQLLLARGANVFAENDDGKKPHDLIAYHSSASRVREMLDAAAEASKSYADRVTSARSDKGPPQVGG